MIMKHRQLITLAGILLTSGANAQEAAGASGVISSRDTVEIRVYREDDLTTRGQLSPSGSVTMPLIGSVRLSGLTTDQAAAAIESRLRDGYLVKPEVSVSIEARVRRTVTVLGQVRQPGVFQLSADRRMSLVEAIGMAGGMTRIANERKVTVKKAGGTTKVVNVKDITRGKASDIKLGDGDVVTIPESLF
jgi:protein involved in polysaccharide export with SLBB domain